MSKLSNAAAEQLLIGSCIKYTDALDAVVEKVSAGDFSDQRAGTIFAAVCRITLAGKSGSVSLIEDLRESGELDAIGGDRAISYLEGKARKSIELVVEAADTIVNLSKKRDQAAAAQRIAKTINDGGDPSGDLDALTKNVPASREGWSDMGSVLSSILDGTYRRIEPSLLERNDGAFLLYPKALNWVAAPPEGMKSFLAQLSCVQLMEKGKAVVYLDFEDSVASCTERICSIALGRGHSLDTVRSWLAGIDGDNSSRLFYYRAASSGFDTADRAQVLRVIKAREISFVVLDGVAAAMGAHNPPLEEDKARDVSLWLAGNVWPLIAAGAGVLCIDHTVKNTNGAGANSYVARSPRGSGAKLAAVSGTALMAEVKEPGSAWTKGVVELFVVKDRPGRVKVVNRSGKRLAGILVSTPQPANDIVECTVIEVLSPEAAAEAAAEKRWDLIAAEQIARLLNELGKPTSKTDVKDLMNERKRERGGKGWKGETLVKAISFLTDYGYVLIERDGRSETMALVKCYRSDYGMTHADDVKGPIGGEPF